MALFDDAVELVPKEPLAEPLAVAELEILPSPCSKTRALLLAVSEVLLTPIAVPVVEDPVEPVVVEEVVEDWLTFPRLLSIATLKIVSSLDLKFASEPIPVTTTLLVLPWAADAVTAAAAAFATSLLDAAE